MRQAGFAYAQARMQARFAARPTALDWQMIETGRDLAQALEAARHGAFGATLAQLGRDSSRAAVESALRQGWVARVEELAGWAPPRWRAALAWMALLPQLRHVALRGMPGVAGADTLVTAVKAGALPGAAWRAGLAARLPRAGSGVDDALTPLAERYLEGPPQAVAATGDLARSLTGLFRSRAQEPAAAIAWLGLMALDFERLRGALLLARMFPARDRGGVG